MRLDQSQNQSNSSNNGISFQALSASCVADSSCLSSFLTPSTTSARCSRTPWACSLTAAKGEPAARVSNSTRSSSPHSGSACASHCRLIASLGSGQACCTQRRSEEHTSELQSHSDLVCRL